LSVFPCPLDFSDYESGGQEFESLRARHYLTGFESESLRNFLHLDIPSGGAAPGKHRIILGSINGRFEATTLLDESKDGRRAGLNT